MRLGYSKRLRTIFHRPSESLKEIARNPSFLETSILMGLASIVISAIAEYGLFKSITPHFVAAYALMFTIIWLVPTLFSLFLLKLFKNDFRSECYIEASALIFFSFLTYVFLCLFGFTVYCHLLADPPRTVYMAIVYYGQLLPLAIMVVIGSPMILRGMFQIGRQIANAKTYQTIVAWAAAWGICAYIVYLLFRGWL